MDVDLKKLEKDLHVSLRISNTKMQWWLFWFAVKRVLLVGVCVLIIGFLVLGVVADIKLEAIGAAL